MKLIGATVFLISSAMLIDRITSALAYNQYIPALVTPKFSGIICPAVCETPEDCFVAHPISDAHFIFCLHGKPIVYACSAGRTFDAAEHRCLSASGQQCSAAKLYQSFANIKLLLKSFEKKMSHMQQLVLMSDNRIAMLVKYLLKAFRENAAIDCKKPAENSLLNEEDKTAMMDVDGVEPGLDESKAEMIINEMSAQSKLDEGDEDLKTLDDQQEMAAKTDEIDLLNGDSGDEKRTHSEGLINRKKGLTAKRLYHNWFV